MPSSTPWSGARSDVGYLPVQDVTKPTTNALKAGPNNPRLTNFTMDPLYTWSINYFPYNFNSNGDDGNAGKIFNQLYFRQAFQYLVDQPLYIKKIYKGYGVRHLRTGAGHPGELVRVPAGPEDNPLHVQPGQGQPRC